MSVKAWNWDNVRVGYKGLRRQEQGRTEAGSEKFHLSSRDKQNMLMDKQKNPIGFVWPWW